LNQGQKIAPLLLLLDVLLLLLRVVPLLVSASAGSRVSAGAAT
jgi:hypothetical protein